jgi:hypothetical protein
MSLPNLLTRAFHGLLTLMVMPVMVMKNVAYSLGFTGASARLEQLSQRVLLPTPCPGAKASQRAHVKVGSACYTTASGCQHAWQACCCPAIHAAVQSSRLAGQPAPRSSLQSFHSCVIGLL